MPLHYAVYHSGIGPIELFPHHDGQAKPECTCCRRKDGDEASNGGDVKRAFDMVFYAKCSAAKAGGLRDIRAWQDIDAEFMTDYGGDVGNSMLPSMALSS
jgi:hypothetical protein